MNTFVITVGGTTFNFKVAAGTTINIQMNGEDSTSTCEPISVIENNVCDDDDVSTISNITDVLSADSEIEILDSIRNVTMRTKNLENEFCRPVKHRYEKDDDGNYMCPYCDAKKKKVNTLSEHVRANHSTAYGRNEETHTCTECDKGFPTKTRLEHHTKTFHAISYEKCPHPECNYNTAKNASTLIQHYVKHHMDYKSMFKQSDNVCVCNDCGASSKTGIMYHLGVCNKSSPFYKNK
jgi:hypothetical protein